MKRVTKDEVNEGGLVIKVSFSDGKMTIDYISHWTESPS